MYCQYSTREIILLSRLQTCWLDQTKPTSNNIISAALYVISIVLFHYHLSAGVPGIAYTLQYSFIGHGQPGLNASLYSIYHILRKREREQARILKAL